MTSTLKLIKKQQEQVALRVIEQMLKDHDRPDNNDLAVLMNLRMKYALDTVEKGFEAIAASRKMRQEEFDKQSTNE